jgi:hypothetical protein
VSLFDRVVLTEGMKTARDLPDDVKIVVKTDSIGDWKTVSISYGVWDNRMKRFDRMSMYRPGAWGAVHIRQSFSVPATRETDGPCDGAWIVRNTEANRGWGPLLYDVAMEYASIHGNGLAPDRGSVSDSAQRVWVTYADKRGDVKSYQLDDMQNTLTPPPADNCRQVSVKDRVGEKWARSPLSRRYVKRPAKTIQRLKKADKIVFLHGLKA